MYLVTQVWHLTEDGIAVDERDPRGVRVLAVPGQEMTDEEARRYGLLEIKDMASTKDIKKPAETKVIKRKETK